MGKLNQGKCYFCGKTFGKTGIRRHLDKCKERSNKNSNGNEDHYIIRIQGYYQKEYWMYVEVSANATLKDLDQFLRDKWLECCGHLSMFKINGEIYDVESSTDMFMFRRVNSMEERLKDVIYKGLEFTHEYDFGSTTILKLNVLSKEKGSKTKDKVVLMARNLPIIYNCKKCGEQATQLCVECIYYEYPFYCDKCAKEHECGEEMMLPVVNSPRMGVCGYCGEDGE
ncbi:MAG: hypothetical protein PWQ37_328 [Candidatus Petromonas sp.]|jgi:hypothetical protein|nr:hypothetical protein [Candidatus Petromonas sp.]